MNAAVVLAAGKGTRLRSSTAKVLHEIAGRSLIGWVLEALRPLDLDRVVVVVGHQGDEVRAHVESLAIPGLSTVVQTEQRGTGHAVRVAVESGALDDTKTTMVLAADVPALTAETLAALHASLVEAGPDVSAAMLTARLADPSGYGRVLLGSAGVTGIVEDRDASPEQRAIDLINAGIYSYRTPSLRSALAQLDTDNAQGEEYLTDTIAILASTGTVSAIAVPPEEVDGVNTMAQLHGVSLTLRGRITDRLMAGGVRVIDPASTFVDDQVTVAADAVLHPGTMLHGRTSVAAGASVGPHSRLTDTTVGEGATVEFTVATDAVIGAAASVGPYTHLRAGTVLEEGAKAGGFVETKKAHIGPGSKVPHLSYVGDATIGAGVNVGAGVITVNYDGKNKHHTTIGDGAFIGSDTMLVAPIEIGPGAYTGAGSTITTDVPADSLAFERGQRRTIDGWAERKRQRDNS